MLFEFLSEQWMLVAIWGALAFTLFFYEQSKAGKSASPQLLSQLVNKEHGIVLDIRDKADFGKGHITDSYNIPYSDLEKRHVELNDYKDKPVVVVCKMGMTASPASKLLKKHGFTNVYKLTGGLSEWTASSLPLVK